MHKFFETKWLGNKADYAGVGPGKLDRGEMVGGH